MNHAKPCLLRACLLVLYAGIVLFPLVLVSVLRPVTDHGFLYTVGKNLALVGFTMLALQFVLSARWKWIERPFGLNILFQFHKAMGVLATVFVLSHPLLLATGSDDWSIIFGPQVMWHIWLGRIALLILLVHVLLASWRAVLRMNYETWRFVHNLGAVLILILAFSHSWTAGGDFSAIGMRVLWASLLLLASASYLWHRVVRRQVLGRHPYTVTAVREEARGVWTIEMAPPADARRFDFLPGQFHFLTFHRAEYLPVEEHHWTISSSPSQQDLLCSTIKESGDFTASIGKTKPGDTVIIDGPFGRFSYALHQDERDLVFIAGGIGITPLMSMLRHIRDTGAKRSVILLYANTSESDIVFRKELDEMQAQRVAHLKVIHVLNHPTPEWEGERGRLDDDRIFTHCGQDLTRYAFYLCAPWELTRKILVCLRESHVPVNRIHFERFKL